jgi:hypothetical protein
MAVSTSALAGTSEADTTRGGIVSASSTADPGIAALGSGEERVTIPDATVVPVSTAGMGVALLAALFSDTDSIDGNGCKIRPDPTTVVCIGSLDVAATSAGRAGRAGSPVAEMVADRAGPVGMGAGLAGPDRVISANRSDVCAA